MILHQIESLAAAGVTDIVLAVNYRPDVMVTALKKVFARNLVKTQPDQANVDASLSVWRTI